MNPLIFLILSEIIWKIAAADDTFSIPKVRKAPIPILIPDITPLCPSEEKIKNNDTFIKYRTPTGKAKLIFCPAKSETEIGKENETKRCVLYNHIGKLLFPKYYRKHTQCANSFKPTINHEPYKSCNGGRIYYVGYWVWIEANKTSKFMSFYDICLSKKRGTSYTHHIIHPTKLLKDSQDFTIDKIDDGYKNMATYEDLEVIEENDTEGQIITSTPPQISTDKINEHIENTGTHTIINANKDRYDHELSNTSDNSIKPKAENAQQIAASSNTPDNSVKPDEEDPQQIATLRNILNKGDKAKEVKPQQTPLPSEIETNEYAETGESSGKLSYDEVLAPPQHIEQINQCENEGKSKYQLVPFDDMPIYSWQITTLFYFNLVSIPVEFKNYSEKVDNYIRKSVVKINEVTEVYTKLFYKERFTFLEKTLLIKNPQELTARSIVIISQYPFEEPQPICNNICDVAGWGNVKKLDNNDYTLCCEMNDSMKVEYDIPNFQVQVLKLKSPPSFVVKKFRSFSLPLVRNISRKNMSLETRVNSF